MDASVLAFQLRDAAGNTQVSLEDLTVELRVTHSDGRLRTTTACSVLITAGGVGECVDNVPAGWFSSASDTSAAATVHVSYGGTQTAQADIYVYTQPCGFALR